ncbi:hypothetical protein PAMP_001464 [Pampus punctatissimus]
MGGEKRWPTGEERESSPLAVLPHLQDRETAEQAHEKEMTSVTLASRERERELTVLLEQTEAQHQQRVGELDGLLSSQNALIRKLKEECCTLGVKLEELTENSRLFELLESRPSVAVKVLLDSQAKSELEQLSLEKQHLEETGAWHTAWLCQCGLGCVGVVAPLCRISTPVLPTPPLIHN